MQGVSSSFADFTINTDYDNLEPEVIHQTKKLILDFMGVSLAGYQLMEFPRLMVDYLVSLGGTPEATIIHIKRKFPAINAALANSACGHALDMDDGHRYAALHPGIVVIPAAISAAELSGAGTKDLIAGVVVGYEVVIRSGMAINPSSLNRGFHPTGITGPFGAAAAAANILGLSREETIGAFGLAGLQASGLLQVNHEVEGAKVKPLNSARAAMSGLLSCILAQKGARGPQQIFEGQDGFLKAVTDAVNHDLLTGDLGRVFEILNVYIKLYAACRHCHAPIDAAFEAFSKAQIGVEEISQITVDTYSAAIRLAGSTDVSSPSAARFSIPFSVALALIEKGAGAEKFSKENISDPNIRQLAGKVRLSVSNKWETLYPKKRGATVTIRTKSDQGWTAEVGLAKGEPENPASWEEIYDKFYTNATLLISGEDAEKLGDTIMNLENSSLEDLIKLI